MNVNRLLIHLDTLYPEEQHIWFYKSPCESVKHIEAKTYGRHFPDDIFKSIFFNKNVQTFIKKITDVCS